MSKQGEINYLHNLSPEGVEHSLRKPFSDPLCGRYLSDIGLIMQLLPVEPGRLLDVGCGTGWTSQFFARRGFDVLGVDISPYNIALAREINEKDGLSNLDFAVQDYEEMVFCNEFDSVLFYDSLHHSENEKKAIASAHRALKPGGVCITCEPGLGHSTTEAAQRVMNTYDVSERDMPAQLIIAAGKEAGFSVTKSFPIIMEDITRLVEEKSTIAWVRYLSGWSVFWRALLAFRIFRLVERVYDDDRHRQLVVMIK
jgi:2-polyprenyl-3-methyl-5-hydroxy-6-metoxy-1,4-benzoquinol methylase